MNPTTIIVNVLVNLVCIFRGIFCEQLSFGLYTQLTYGSIQLLESIPNIDLGACISSCKRTDRCRYINYRRHMNLCLLLEDKPGMMFHEILATIPLYVYWKKPFGEEDSDVSDRQPAGCGPPPAINNTILRGNMYTVDSKIKYICTNNESNTQVTTCQQNGTWTNIKRCIPADFSHRLPETFASDECYISRHVYQSSCYVYSSTKTIWQYAKENCEALGGYLADIKSEEEMNFITGYIQSYPGYPDGGDQNRIYIGLTDLDEEGSFVWLDGSPMTYSNWHGSEPNGNTNEHCTMFTSWNSLWYDMKCSRNLGSLCEFEL